MTTPELFGASPEQAEISVRGETEGVRPPKAPRLRPMKAPAYEIPPLALTSLAGGSKAPAPHHVLDLVEKPRKSWTTRIM